MADLQQAIDAFVNMEDAFKGKAGNAMRGYFRDFHQPFLLYLQSFLSEYNEQLNKVLKDLSAFEPDPDGYIQEAFVQDGVISALKKLENTVGYLLEDANAAMRKVSDLVSLPKLDVEEKLYYIQKARKKANKTLEHLYDFDSKAASTLDSLDKDMDTMERFVRQMELMAGDGSLDIATYNPKQFVTTEAYRSLEGELIQKAGVKPVKTMRAQDFGGHLSVKFHVYEDGVTVMEYRKQGSKQVYYELVDEIPKEAIPREKKPDDPLYMDIWNGIYEGSGKAVGDTIEGLETLLNPRTYISMGYNGAKYVNQLISSPEETLKSTASRTIDMAKYMGMAVKNAFERDVINGDAKSRTAFFTYAFVFIGLSALGDKGISKISTAGKAMNAGRLAEKAEKLRVNTGVTPALEAAGAEPAKIPYNVMDNLGVRIQKAAEERWTGNKDAGKDIGDGTVWENIRITQPLYEGTKIPKSFELVVDGEKFWVHPNGTKHMVEYITREATTHGMPINSQTLLSSFQSSVKDAVKEGVKYDEIMNTGNWELIFSKPRGEGLLPVIKHAVYRP
nr:LXG domain-containing protein [Heyndrickxia coagulans]